MSVQNTVLRALRPSCRLMSTKATPPTRSRSRYLWLSLLPIAAYFAWPSKRPLNPQVYTEQRVGDNKPLPGGRHSLLTIPVSEGAQFGPGAAAALGIGLPERTVMVQHVMVRSSALMIERPYTPVNDVDADGEARLVVKRVPGGEVGR
jgi:cytochrome-b5 reductase